MTLFRPGWDGIYLVDYFSTQIKCPKALTPQLPFFNAIYYFLKNKSMVEIHFELVQ